MVSGCTFKLWVRNIISCMILRFTTMSAGPVSWSLPLWLYSYKKWRVLLNCPQKRTSTTTSARVSLVVSAQTSCRHNSTVWTLARNGIALLISLSLVCRFVPLLLLLSSPLLAQPARPLFSTIPRFLASGFLLRPVSVSPRWNESVLCWQALMTTKGGGLEKSYNIQRTARARTYQSR